MTDIHTKFSFLKSILARRFILYILVFSSLVTLLGTSFQLYLDFKNDRALIQKTLDQIKDSRLRSFVNHVWLSDLKQINIHMQEILALPNIQYVEFTNGDKERTSVGVQKSKNILSRRYPLVYSFRNKEINLGSLYIEATLDNTFKWIVSRALLILLTHGFEIFLVSLFIFYVFYQFVGRHLHTMAEYARGLDLETINTPLRLYRSERKQHDELDMVVSSLNQMRTSLLKDIAGRKKSEDEIARRKAEFEAIFNSITDAIVFVDTERRIIRINPAFTEQFGYVFEEVKGRTTTFLFADPDAYNKQEKIRYNQRADIAQSAYEMEYRKKDGAVFPAETLGAHVQDQTGAIIGFLGIIRDISARQHAEAEKEKLEEQLRQSHKMEAVGTMAGGIAHDFNNILAIILGNAEIALDDLPPGNPARRNVHEVIDASIRAKDLVRQILAFSRKERQELIPLHPQVMLKETLKLLRSITPTTISIIQEISQECGMIMADPTQLHQLVMNLFTNAVHAMDEKGTVTVRLREVNVGDEIFNTISSVRPLVLKTPGRYAKLSVTDEGTGMTRETIERIFDPFYTTKEIGKGTGMGLSVVYGIAESHDGFITVESEVGRGSTFNVFFPITKNAEEDIATEVTPHFQTGTEHILLVDDEEDLLKMAKRMLESLNYTVTIKSDSIEALETFKSAPDEFDLVITDQSMPNMSGSELTAEIRKIRPAIPVILCTGYSTKVSAENAEKMGISKYVGKPYSKKTMSEAIKQVLDEQLT